jgi:5-methylcytosine-specific restriction endonuclease McrA
MGIENIDMLKPDDDPDPDVARECPYCGHKVYSTQAEIDHMNEKHPDVIAERLRNLS